MRAIFAASYIAGCWSMALAALIGARDMVLAAFIATVTVSAYEVLRR